MNAEEATRIALSALRTRHLEMYEGTMARARAATKAAAEEGKACTEIYLDFVKANSDVYRLIRKDLEADGFKCDFDDRSTHSFAPTIFLKIYWGTV